MDLIKLSNAMYFHYICKSTKHKISRTVFINTILNILLKLDKMKTKIVYYIIS